MIPGAVILEHPNFIGLFLKIKESFKKATAGSKWGEAGFKPQEDGSYFNLDSTITITDIILHIIHKTTPTYTHNFSLTNSTLELDIWNNTGHIYINLLNRR